MQIFSFQRVEYREFLPENAIEGANQVHFTFPGYLSETMYKFDQLVLQIAVKYTTKTGEVIPSASQVAPINMPLTSIFSACRVYVGGVVITPQAGNFGMKAYLETLLSFDDNQKGTYLTAAGYYQVKSIITCAVIKRSTCTFYDMQLLTLAGRHWKIRRAEGQLRFSAKKQRSGRDS